MANVALSTITSVDALLFGTKWGSNVLSFSFPTVASLWPDYSNPSEPTQGFVAFSTAEQDAVASALTAWSSLANISFSQSADSGSTSGNLRFGYTTWQMGLTQPAYAYLPATDTGTSTSAGDVWLNADFRSGLFNDLSPGSVGGYTLLHEIGHALGLKHPGDPSVNSSAKLDASQDSMFNSVMSNNVFGGIAYQSGNVNIDRLPTTPMSYDIDALQYLYGANTTTNSGNTAYTFSDTGKYLQTIYDMGGIDTITLTGTTGGKIDLNPSGWSEIGTPVQINGSQFQIPQTVQIYHGSVIENATGSNGADVITGNSANNVILGNAGNDTIAGSAGVDILTGGLGADTFVLTATMSGSTISDFSTAQGDVLDISSFELGSLALSGASIIYNGQILVTFSDTSVIPTDLTDYSSFLPIPGQNIVGTSFDDSLVGGAGNDTIYGFEGYDTLDGGAGDDILVSGIGYSTLVGGLGADTMIGGLLGDDYYVDNVGDVVIAYVSNDGDHIYSSADSFSIPDYVHLLSLEGSGDFNAAGNDIGDEIYGNTGSNSITGGLGGDYISGGVWGIAYGGNDHLIGGGGADTLDASWSDASWLDGGSGNDYLLGSMAGDTLLGGGGNDVLNGGSGDDSISGNIGNDELHGGVGDNSLEGGLGNDKLYGEGGANAMAGGLGDDTYFIGSGVDTVTENSNGGTDTVVTWMSRTLDANVENLTLTGTNILGIGNNLDNVFNSALWGNNQLQGGLGNDTYIVGVGDTVIENAGEGTDTVRSGISWTLDQNLENLTLTGSSPIDGTGNVLNNIITGNSGNNRLDGGEGSDTLFGGQGNDIYVVDNSGDQVDESAGGGTDTVESANSYSLVESSYLLGSIENLTLTNTGTTGTGNDQDNGLTSNSGYNTLIGGLGNDTYVVTYGDVIDESTGDGTDTVKSAVDFSLVESDFLKGSVENLTLTNTGTTGTGNDLSNVIISNSGGNTLIGGLGNDTYVVLNGGNVIDESTGDGIDTVQSSISYSLVSTPALLGSVENLVLTGTGTTGTGNDLDNVISSFGGNTLIGGLGNDTYVVSNGSDVIDENTGDGIDTVQSAVDFSLVESAYLLGSVENLTLTDAAIYGTGNTLDNVISGNGSDNVLDGGIGADTLMGGQGNDTFVVDNTLDVVTEYAVEGTDTVQTSVAYTLSANVENLTLTGIAAITGTGNDLDNVITGNSNVSSSLVGGLGNDTYVLGSTGNIISEAAGEGIDTVVSGISWTLGSNIENLTLTGTAAINGTGNALDNVITGNSADNILDGGDGNDTLTGGFGNDSFSGGYGNDVLNVSYSGYEQITVDGGAGNDIVNFTGTASGPVSFSDTDTWAESNGSIDTAVNAGVLTQAGLSLVGGFLQTYPVSSYYTPDPWDYYKITVTTQGVLSATLAELNPWSNADLHLFNSSGVEIDSSAQPDTQFNFVAIAVAAGDYFIGVNCPAGNWGSADYSLDITQAGNTGSDVIATGGDGVDTYVLQSGSGFTGLTITDFTAGPDGDKIDLSQLLDYSATHFGYNGVTNNFWDFFQLVQPGSDTLLQYDADGSGTGSIFTTAVTLKNVDLGTLATDNFVNGVDSGPRIVGNPGADTMAGAAGSDSYIVDNIGDVVTEQTGQGVDTVLSSVSYTLPDNVENFVLTGSGNINATGNAGDNLITGNSGNNTFDGGGGNDTVTGGAGSDTYLLGPNGVVTITDFSEGPGGDRLDLSALINSMYATNPWNFSSDPMYGHFRLEDEFDGVHVRFSQTDNVRGDGVDVAILKNVTTDWITPDNFFAASDMGHSGYNYVVEWTNDSVSNLNGSNDGEPYAIDPMVGAKTSNNIFYVDDSSDLSAVADYVDKMGSSLGGSINLVVSSINYTLQSYLSDLQLSEFGNISGTGNALANHIDGNAGSNVLDGKAGDDTIDGGNGNDVLTGGTGNDLFVEDMSNAPGTDEITDFSFGESIRLSGTPIALTGPVTLGDGTSVGLNQAQLLSSGGVSELFIGTDGIAGADLTLYLDGTFQAANFFLSGTDILYNNAPMLTPGGAAVLAAGTEDTPYTFNSSALLTGWTDIDAGSVLSFSGLTANHGTLTNNNNGTWTFNPVLNYNGLVTLSYSVTDGATTSAATLGFTLAAVNDAPTWLVAPPTAASYTDTASANDSFNNATGLLQGADVDTGTTLTYGISSGTVASGTNSKVGTYGTLSVNTSTGIYTYTPSNTAIQSLKTGQSGSDLFTFTVSDGSATTTSPSYTVSITGANDPTTFGGATSATLSEDSPTPQQASGNLMVSDPDTGDAVITAQNTSQTYGTFNIVTGGAWTYTLSSAAQTLTANQTVTDTFTVATAGGISQLITLTINGANDAPTWSVTPPTTASYVDTAANDTFNATSGTLIGADVDTGTTLTYGITGGTVASGSNSKVGTYGTLSVNTSTGAYSYIPNNTAIQGLKTGQNPSDIFTFTLSDGIATTTSANYTVSITGANDTTTFGGAISASLSEDSVSTDGTLTVSDPDYVGAVSDAAITTQATTHTYGSFSIGSSGAWTYTLSSAAQALTANQIVTDTFTVVTAGGTSQAITLTINGVNDAPTLTDSQSHLNFGTESLPYTVTKSNLLAGWTDADAGTVLSVTGLTADHGVALDAGGTSWTITPDSGYFGPMTLSYSVSDSIDPVATNLTYDVIPLNSVITPGVPVDLNLALPAGVEDTSFTVSLAQLLTGWTDANLKPMSISSLTADHGTVINNNDNTWTITPTANYNGTVTLSYVITDTDLVAHSPTVHLGFSLAAVNDAPTLATPVAADIVDTAANDSFDSATGTLQGADVDTGTTPVSTPGTVLTYGISGGTVASGFSTQSGSYGSLSVNTTTGDYSYTPDSSTIQSLNSGENYSDTFTVTVSDGIAAVVTKTYMVNITGANDAPVAVNDTGSSLSEDSAAVTVSGSTLLANDTDRDAVDTKVISAVSSSTSGVTVSLNGSNVSYDPGTAFQYLNAGESTTDTFTYTMVDSGGLTSNATVTMTITGANDTPTLAPTSDSFVDTIADDSFSNATGTLSGADVDAGTVLTYGLIGGTVASGVNSKVGTYGTLSVDTATGAYSYTPNYAAIQGLTTNDAESFTVTVSDDVAQATTATYTVNLTGFNDPTTFGGAISASLSEDSVMSGSGTLVTSDRDNGDATILAQSNTAGTYGQFNIGIDGAWTYSLNNDAANVQTLSAGQSVTDIFTVSSGSGDTQPITMTILGTNDAPVSQVDYADSLTEDGTTFVSTGSVLTNDSDVDQGDVLSVFMVSDQNDQPGNVGQTIKGIYGTLVLNADGSYAYTLANDSSAVQSLNRVDAGLDSFTYTVSDIAGATSSNKLWIGIYGTNDAPTVSNPIADQKVVLGKEFTFAVPGNTFVDIDNGDHLVLNADLSNAPAWLSFDPATKTFKGTPSATDKTGIFTVSVQATDGLASVKSTFKLDVVNQIDATALGIKPAKGTDGNDEITVGTGNIAIDAGAGDDIVHGGTGKNTILGGVGADVLSGGAGDDKLSGGAGDDTLSGDAGKDNMDGGGGNDTYIVDNIGDKITELKDGGTDEVQSSVSYTLGKFIENLTLTGVANINATGNELANILTGNSGNNILDGSKGSESYILDGLHGEDKYIGGQGNDTYILDEFTETDIIEYAGEGNDTIQLKVNTPPTGGSNYTLVDNVENLILTGTSQIDLTGNAEDNILTGNARNNTLTGLDGNDTLSGGKGKDVLTGGNGADIFKFDTAPARSNVDTITDFESGTDHIGLDSKIFKKLLVNDTDLTDNFKIITTEEKATDSDNFLLYNKDTGSLYYDADGKGSGKAVEIAVLIGVADHLTATDFEVM
jgi:VCBS repeat-containing protein